MAGRGASAARSETEADAEVEVVGEVEAGEVEAGEVEEAGQRGRESASPRDGRRRSAASDHSGHEPDDVPPHPSVKELTEKLLSATHVPFPPLPLPMSLSSLHRLSSTRSRAGAKLPKTTAAPICDSQSTPMIIIPKSPIWIVKHLSVSCTY